MTTTDVLARRARVLVEVDEVARLIAPLWPLGTFIAVNPLWDLREKPFAEAVVTARRFFGGNGYPSDWLLADAFRAGRITDADMRMALVEQVASFQASPQRAEEGIAPSSGGRPAARSPLAGAVNREVVKWCSAHLGGLTPATPPGGFFAAWRTAVARDPGATGLVGRDGRARLAALPERPEGAVVDCLDRLGLGEDQWGDELASQITALPGWAGHAKWRSRWAPPGHPGPELPLVDFVAVRLAYDTELRTRRPRQKRRSRVVSHRAEDERVGGHQVRRTLVEPPDYAGPALSSQLQEALDGLGPDGVAQVWLAAYEGHYRDQLLGQLDRPLPVTGDDPQAQVVCCIDARSEGLRRHLEAVGSYETFGFAGFFALPMRYRAIGAEPVDLCPVLLAPTVEMNEVAAPGAASGSERRLAGQQVQAQTAAAFGSTREGAIAPFMLAEAGGFFAVPVLATKTLGPSRFRRLQEWTKRTVSPPASRVIDADPDLTAMSNDEQALFAETALTTMGCTGGFAPVVVLCGHGSTTANNPHAAALDCGACGGNRGADSARAACAILNRGMIRSLLAERHIAIPESTWFVAAEHDTATDRVRVLDSHLVPASHRAAVEALEADLDTAGRALAIERCVVLPGTKARSSAADVATRSADWAEIQPEWGLAQNAAFIVGPRSVTSGIDLGRRAFLHSYDAGVDPDGTALETILTAPMVVAHWINAQYYFSTVDPEVFAAGDKTVHNIVAGMGVTEGAGGDLKVGLPLQSLFDEDRAFHEPLRLLTVVQAPLALIDAVIARNPVLRQLFDGQWVHLAARHQSDAHWHRRTVDGRWTPWTPADDAAQGLTRLFDEARITTMASKGVEQWMNPGI